jgi:uncharacterized integral membrane protein
MGSGRNGKQDMVPQDFVNQNLTKVYLIIIVVVVVIIIIIIIIIIINKKLCGLSQRANYTERLPLGGEVSANFCG